MRLPVAYEEYFGKYNGYCKVKQIDAPYWVDLEKRYFYLLKYVADELYDLSSATNIPKYYWEYLEKLTKEPIVKDAHLSTEMYNEAVYTRDRLVAMYYDVMSDKDKNLCPLNQCTVTRFGRRVMRSYLTDLRDRNYWVWHALSPLPNIFSNVIGGARFGNGVECENDTISLLVHSCIDLQICIYIGRESYGFPFTEPFLDGYIKLCNEYKDKQEDKVSSILNELDDNTNLLADNYIRAHCFNDHEMVTFNLMEPPQQSLLYDILKLVAENYRDEFVKNGINLPWMKYL